MFDKERWAVVFQDHKYVLHTMSGEEELYDLAADPQETKNLARKMRDELEPYRRQLAAATGWSVGPGWRVTIQHLQAPLVLTFATPPLEAGVIDPEAGRENRANLEFGEVPPLLVRDIATVEITGNDVRVTPGREPSGTVFVLGPAADAPSQARVGEGEPVPLTPGHVRVGETTLRVSTGTVIVVRDTEAQALAEEQDPEAIDALKALGYVGED
jgi:hypothetical protein